MPQDRKPKWTALGVLAGVWLTYCDPKTRSLVDKETAEYARLAIRATGSPFYWLLKCPPLRWYVRWKESRMLPGICSHYTSRKNSIQQFVQKAEPERLIILGAGLDGLGYRHAARIEVCEADLPASQELKQDVLGNLPDRPIRFIPVDLSQPGFHLDLEPGHCTVTVAEGLLMYLPEERVRAVLREAARVSQYVIFTFMSLLPNGTPGFGVNQDKVDRLLAKTGEPFHWGLALTDLPAFAQSCGLQLNQTVGGAALDLPGHIVNADMIPGEWIAYCSANSDSM